MSEIAADVSQTPVVSADPVSSFSFDKVHEQAMAYGESDTPAEQEHVASEPEVVTPQVEQPVGEVQEPKNVDNATSAQLAKLKDTDLVEVTVDGQPVQLPWSEARGMMMRQAKFTKEMQSLRDEQRQFQTQRQQQEAEDKRLRGEHEALVGLLKNKDLLREFIAKQYPDLVQQAKQEVAEATNIDPNDIATVGQLHEYQKQVEARLGEVVGNLIDGLNQELQEREQAIASNIQDRQETLKLATEINTTIQSLFKEHPYIEKLIPDAEQVLRYNVLKLNPTTPQDTVEAFKTVFGGWVEQYESTVAETTKSKAISKQKLVTNNIQPPGGTGVQPQPTQFKKTNPMTGKQELDWSKIHEAALAYKS